MWKRACGGEQCSHCDRRVRVNESIHTDSELNDIYCEYCSDSLEDSISDAIMANDSRFNHDLDY